MDQLQRFAHEEFLGFDRPPYLRPVGLNAQQLALLSRGLRYRVVYDHSALDLPGRADLVRALVAAGEEARVVPRLPVKLCIADRSVALLPLTSASSPTAMIVRRCSLLDALVALFEAMWEHAAPLRMDETASVGPEGSPLRLEDAQVLSLLMAGLTDQAIANQLELSVRTVQRRVRAMMELAGVTSRIQLGWYAAKRNWL